MSYNYKFKQKRSFFYLTSFENDENITLVTNKFTKKLIRRCQYEIENLSPTGFKKSKNYNDLYTLWIPNDRINFDILDDFIEWAIACNSCVWVKLNRYTMDHFEEGVLDFCICSDWNFNFDGVSGHTEIGNVEYRLKYVGNISEDDIKIIEEYLNKCLFCINGYDDDIDNILITTIPATVEKQNKPSWKLAEYVADSLNAAFLTATLFRDKPQMKALSVSDKIKSWRKIYADNQVELSIDIDSLNGKTVIIVDDLYQSGTSMWCYAEYLKSVGVSHILGIAMVKSLKDSDNQPNH